MGIFERFADIMSSNINALLDKCEDPEKMIDQYLRKAMEDLADVKKETAGVMAVEKQTKRLYDEHMLEVNKYTELARKALASGSEEDAKVFLAKKQSLDANTETLKRNFSVAHANSVKLREMHNKLANNIMELKGRRNSVKATMSVAKTQKTINKMGDASAKIEGSLGAFARMEEKANAMLDTENSMAELNEEPVDAASELQNKYGSGSSLSVDSELEKMKLEMGLSEPEAEPVVAEAAPISLDDELAQMKEDLGV